MLKFLPVSGLVIFRYSASSSGVTKPSSLVSTSSNKSYELSRIFEKTKTMAYCAGKLIENLKLFYKINGFTENTRKACTSLAFGS